ncbi:histidine phosphatase family protein [Cohnella hongkongensis]|uniref:Histidine phosphatase family protein n=1 Tax=Cohnella hongkongensis TaxID=178337 RepID=A0ABV9FKS8_9BACL
MSINLYIVRHAIKERAIGDVPLTSDGILQAKLTSQYFSRISLSMILSSPLRRAQETAEYTASVHNLSIKIDNRLRERANWGDLPGQTFQEFVEMWDKCTKDPDYIPPFGDSARQACERMSSLLNELVKNLTSNTNILIVTHGGLITDYLVNTFPENVLNNLHPRFIAEQSNLIPECSITKLRFDKQSFIIEQFADIEHLKTKNFRR